MRVLTLNLWGRRGGWEARRAMIAEGLRKLEPDLIAFQEAVVEGGYDQTAELLGPDFHYAHQAEREHGEDGVERGQGTSIASRWLVDELREVDLHVTPRTAGFACTTLLAEIDAPLGRLVFANHVPSWQLHFERERELQALAAARVLEEVDAEHVILAGDFTSDPQSANVSFISGRRSLEGMSVCYRDAWESVHGDEPGETFTPKNPLVSDWDWPFRRLDYIFVRCGEHGGPTLQITACERVFDEPVDGVWASDHFGVMADLERPTG